MYGKSFESMFEGSMVGAGLNVFAVWGYIITKAKRGFIEINPKLLAFTLGGAEEEVQKALDFLQQPDPNSRSKSEDGRRLVKEGQFQYRIVNWQIYDEIKNEIERRDYNRVRQQQFRERQQASTSVNNGQHSTLPISPVNPPAVPEKLPDPQPVKSGNVEQALAIYDAYPRKVQRKDALVAIGKALKKMDFEKLLAVTRQYAEAKAGADMKFVPHPATWFNGEEFFDDPAMWNLPEVVSGAPRKPSLPERELARLVRQQAEAAECAADKSAVIDMSWMTKKMKPSIQEENEA